MAPALKLSIGARYGRLVVISQSATKHPRGHQLLNCRCDCGRELAVPAGHLRRGNSRSCGCVRIEKLLAQTLRHGHAKRGSVASGTYTTWQAMRGRCYYKRDPYYAKYGARGISVCKAWRESFESFLNDMRERPAGCTIDRIDNRFGYFPANCRWATKEQQTENRRNVGRKTSYKDWPKLAALIATSPYRTQQETRQ